MYLQMVGRGLRPSPDTGKVDCLLIDHGHVVENLGLPQSDFGWTLDSSRNVNKEALDRARTSATEQTRTCKACTAIWLTSEQGNSCPECGWKPEPKSRAIAVQQAELEEMADAEEPINAADPRVLQFFREACGWYAKRWPDRWLSEAQNSNSGRWASWMNTIEKFKFQEGTPNAFLALGDFAGCTDSRGRRLLPLQIDQAHAFESEGCMMQAAEIHARVSWPAVLEQLGIPKMALRNKHGPCPACGGRDRFRFDHEKRGRGSYICSPGVAPAMGSRSSSSAFTDGIFPRHGDASSRLQASQSPPRLGRRPHNGIRLLRHPQCRICACIAYGGAAVDSRIVTKRWTTSSAAGLWPLLEAVRWQRTCRLSISTDPQRIGRYSALLADVVDIEGELVTAHLTYLDAGKKLRARRLRQHMCQARELPPARKILSKTDGVSAVQCVLCRATDTLGIAEGIETALSAAADRWLASMGGTQHEPPCQVRTAPANAAACHIRR